MMDVHFLLAVICAVVTSAIAQSRFLRRYCNGRTGSFPHPDRCDQYVVCGKQRVVYVMDCPISLHFNALRGYCDYPYRANCQPTSLPPPTACEDIVVCPNHVKYFQFPDWSNCSSYYVCTSGNTEKRFCPDGLRYDFLNWKCTFPEETTCFEPTDNV